MAGTNITQSTKVISNTTQLSGVYSLPYARSIPIVAECTGMKPFTALHAFNDNTSIDQYILPCTQLVITGESTPFLGYRDISPANTWNLLRSINTFDYQPNITSVYPNGMWESSHVLAKGEVIRFYQTPTQFVAGIVVARQVEVNAVTKQTQTVLHVALIRQYNTASNYTDNFTNYSFGGLWNSYSFINGIWNPGGSMFAVGNTIKGDSSGATATISAVYAPAPGVMQTNSLGNFFGVYMLPPGSVRAGTHQIDFTDSVNNDLNSAATYSQADFTSQGTLDVYTNTIVSEVDTFVTQTVDRIIYTDPVAETFVIPQDKTDGVFATSVDLFFYQKSPSETQPVIVQICETVNGYPSTKTLFNAVAQMSPDQINVSANASVATRFRFAGPVYLAPGIEYCIKVLTNSVTYKVWVAQMGEPNIQDPSKSVARQPYLGVFFQSQNNSTWTANQSIDLTFNLNYAQFNTAAQGLLILQNQGNTSALASLPANPFQVANGQILAKVHFPDHGLPVGGQVIFTGSNNATFNGTFLVNKVINTDYFTIALSAPQTFNGLTGGNTVMASKSVKYDLLSFDVGQNYSLKPGTNLGMSIAMATATSKDNVTTSMDWSHELELKDSTRYIHSDQNEALFLGGKKSLDVNITLTSNTPNLSPLLNRNTLNMFVSGNKINNPQLSDSTVVDNHALATAQTGLTFTAGSNVIGVPTSVDISTFKIGAYITISGTNNNNITAQIINIDTSTSPYNVYVNGTLVNETPAAANIVQADGYVDEIAPIGSTSESKYLTQAISLATPATGLQLMFSAVIPPAASLKLYYRTVQSSSNKKIATLPWVPVTMNYTASQDKNFVDQMYTINALSNFNTAQFKIVLQTTDTTQVPIVKDFRAICLA